MYVVYGRSGNANEYRFLSIPYDRENRRTTAIETYWDHWNKIQHLPT